MRNAHGSTNRWAKAGLSGAVALAVSAGLVVANAGPAAADPATAYVAVGSDTIQDVMDQFALIVGGGAVGSWDAVNPGNPTATHDTINPKAGCIPCHMPARPLFKDDVPAVHMADHRIAVHSPKRRDLKAALIDAPARRVTILQSAGISATMKE